MRALGRLARGLSALFWEIPLTLIAAVETARTDWVGFLGPLAFAPVLGLTGFLWFGLRQLRDFQKQERVWQASLQRAEIFAIINIGLAPFLFWWHRFPFVPFYMVCVEAMAVGGLLFLMQLNHVLRRLAAMLPDETLRAETRTFTDLNIVLLSIVLGCVLLHAAFNYGLAVSFLNGDSLGRWQEAIVRLVLFLALMPVAMTLAMLWKTKESIFAGLFQASG